MNTTFNIGFFEFSFLVEACVPPSPIARTMFWKDVINRYYHTMTSEERGLLHEWIGNSFRYKNGMYDKDEDCLVFDARFNPDNQYTVTTHHNEKTQVHDCFKFKDRYHTAVSTSILEEYITNVEKISPHETT